jgi:predicted outer membrane repeat protein
VSNSTFSGNTAGRSGGAISADEGTRLEVSNSTFSGNIATNGVDGDGGAIWVQDSTATITNSTFSGNTADTDSGGGVRNAGNATLTLSNTLLANNAGGNCSGTVTDGGGNLEWPDASCGFATPSADPKLGPLQDNGGPTQTHALLAGSAAIDAAVDCSPPTTDQRGVARPQGVACDIGAFELDDTPPRVTIDQASGQADSTSTSPIHFTAVFDEPVTGFTDPDVNLSGTAGATTVVVTKQAPNDGTTYDVAVSGMTTSGTVIASIPANAAQDFALNGNTASTSTDNTVTYTALDTTPPTIKPPPNNITVEATSPDGAAVVYGTNQDNSCSASDEDPNLTLNYSGPPSGSTFPLGISLVTCTATDSSGNSSSATFNVIVQDTTAPTVSCSVSPSTLSLPANNHKLVRVNADVTVEDSGSGQNGFTLVSVASNQADSGLGPDDVPNDIQGWTDTPDDTSGQLRAERYGKDRIYTLTYQGRTTLATRRPAARR